MRAGQFRIFGAVEEKSGGEFGSERTLSLTDGKER